MLKKFKYLVEFAIFWLFYQMFRMLPMDVASGLGGVIGRYILYYLPVSNVARRNLNMAFPEKKAQEVDKIVRDVWENLGRNAGEFPHMMKMDKKEYEKRIDISGTENLRQMVEDGIGGIIFTAHFANWEALSSIFKVNDFEVHIIYRHLNNAFIDRYIARQRSFKKLHFYTKTKAGSQGLVKALKNGKTVAMLPDQKLNEGIAIPFFGKPAMTAPLIATIARKYDYPISYGHMVRTKGAYFKVELSKPLKFVKTKDEKKDVENILVEMNKIIEGWIRENPGQWFWLHNRWK